jgi:transposase-like protein
LRVGEEVLVGEARQKIGSRPKTIESVAERIGCARQSLQRWVAQSERDAGKRAGLSTTERERLKQLEQKNRELKRANEILRTASAFFAQAELDRRRK